MTYAQNIYTPNVSNVGLPFTGVFSGGSIDSVQVQNGNLHVDIPLLHLPGIGMDTDIHFVYDNQLFNLTPVQYGSYQHTLQWNQITIGRNGFVQVSDPLSGILKIGTHGEDRSCYTTPGAGGPWQYTYLDYMNFTDPDGTGHAFRVQGYEWGLLPQGLPDCTPFTQPMYYPDNSFSQDVSGYNLTLDNSGTVLGLTDKHGKQYTFGAESNTWALPSPPSPPQTEPQSVGEVNSTGSSVGYMPLIKVEDSNGNMITNSGSLNGSYTLTDTVGRTITETAPSQGGFNIPDLQAEAPANQPGMISYIDENGITEKITIGYTQFNIDLPLLCGSNPNCGVEPGMTATLVSTYLPTSIVLQNGDTYSISYLLDGSGATLGEISSITLPTGGVISYTWSGIAHLPGGILGRTVQSRTVTANGQSSTWQFQYPYCYFSDGGAGQEACVFTGTVTDPNLNDTVYTFSGQQVTQEVSYNGSQTANNPIATKTIGYTVNGCGSGIPPTSNVFTWNASGMTTETDTTYDAPLATGATCANGGFVTTRGNVTSKTIYDYGVNAHGALLSKTQYSYLHNTSTNPAYAAANIADRVSQVSVYNAANSLVTQTTISYDGFSQSAQGGLAAAGWTTNHDSTFNSGQTLRGLPTSVTKCSGPSSVPCNSSITTYTDYNVLGQPTVSTDGRGYSSTNTYSYATGNPANTDTGTAFLITTTMPSTTGASHVMTQYQDVNTGLMIAKSDQNNNLTTQTFDPLMRPLCTGRPDTGTTCNNYQTSTQVITTVTESPSPAKVTTTNLDGMGRKVAVSTTADSTCGSLTVNTIYDQLNRVSAVSNPHCNSPQSTDGWTQYAYDAISRLTTTTNPDGSAQTWSFNGNVIDSYDEVGNHWRRTYNAQDWLTQVLEPNGTTSIGSAPTLETDYSYDTLGNLLRVDQWGGPYGSTGDHVRTFAYDATSRLIASNNPESASAASPASQACAGTASGTVWTTCYSYDNNSNLSSKIDNRSITTSYGYDALNRVLSKTYNDGTPAVAFAYDNSSISGSSNDIGELTQATVSSGSTVLASTSTYAYNSMGRLLGEQQCTRANCGSSTYNLSYTYDLGGKPTSATFPSNAPTSGASSGGPVTLAYSYDNAERLLTSGSSWSDSTTHPGILFQVSNNSSTPAYGPLGLENASLGVNASTNAATAELLRAYDARSRVVFEADSTSSNLIAGGTDSSGTITITGTEKQVTKTNTSGTAVLTITGSEGSNQVCTAYTSPYSGVEVCTGYETEPDSGLLEVTIQGFTAMASYGGGSTEASVAASLAAALNVAGSPVTATSNGNTVTMTSVATGLGSNYPFTTNWWSSFPSLTGADFCFTGATGTLLAGTLQGGWTGGTYYDTGTLTALVSGTEVQVPWLQGSTPSSLASSLASAINSAAGGFVTAAASGSTVKLTSLSAGPETDWTVTASATDTANPLYFSAGPPNFYTGGPSFSVATTNMGGGAINEASATASFTFSGTEQSASTSGSTPTYSTATLTFSGAEQSMTSGPTVIYDSGAIMALIFDNGANSAPCDSIAVYGNGSTPTSLATALASSINSSCSSGVSATANGAIVTVTSITPGAASNYGITITGGHNTMFLSWSFTLTPSGATMTGGSGGGTGITYDSGAYQVAVSSGQSTCTSSVPFGQGSTAASLAATLATNINSLCSSLVTATANGAVVSIASIKGGAGADYGIQASMTGGISSTFPNGSFALTPSGSSMTGGTGSGTTFYSYLVPTNGYAPNGNLLNVIDSVTGTWNYTYDNLNRLVGSAAGTSAIPGFQAYYAGAQTGWSYDAFGNRLNEQLGGMVNNSMPASSTASYTPASNQVASMTYDAAGDVTYDGLNSYLYDAEGRLCAVKNYVGTLTGYIYDAAGTRVAKGSLTSFSCNFASNGFLVTSSYVLGPGGEQVTEYSVSGATSTWVHTNAFAGGKLLATYNGTDTIFALQDWLGSKRVEVGASGCATTFASLPFGDGLTTGSLPGYSPCMDATEHHYTGKERDTESGNDYFEARYYSSAMGRFLSPDWSAQEEPVPYAKLDNPQTLNLYSYVQNNPLTSTDPTGHEGCCDLLPTMDEVDAVAKPLIDSAVTGVEDAAGVTVQGALGVVGFLFTAGVGSTATASHDQLYNEDTGERYVPEPQAASGGAMKGTGRGGQNDDTKAGQDAHRDFSEKAKAKGWQVEPRLTDPKTGQTVKPDAVTGTGKPVELKPNTASGRAKGRSQLKKYERATGKKGRVVYYDKPKQPNQ
ncbi:MAG: RHS repeat-associated core domain-containing protein [Terracidiphilus sp.]